MPNDADICLCNDNATAEDSLGFKPYVEAIAEFLTNKNTKAPITLSIEGQWGFGKSSFMKQLKEQIEIRNLSHVKIRIFLNYLLSQNKGESSKKLTPLINILTESLTADNQNLYSLTNKLKAIILYSKSKIKRKEYFTVWFNCWRYEKENELWAAFAINLMDQLSSQLSLMRLFLAQLKLRFLRLKFKWKGKNSIYLNIFMFIFLSCLFITSIVYSFSEIIKTTNNTSSVENITKNLPFIHIENPLVSVLMSVLVILVGILVPILPMLRIGKDLKDTILNPFDFSKFSSNPNYAEHISLIENFQSDFGKIIKSYIGDSRVYVFVDDLDRCQAPKAGELMQALNLMISDASRIYYCMGMDRKTVAAGIAAKHKEVLPYLGGDGLLYGYSFIEKLIQLPFKVPVPKKKDLKGLLDVQEEQINSPKIHELFGKLLSKFFNQPKNPNSTKSFEEKTSSSELNVGDKKGKINPKKNAEEESREILNNNDCRERSENNKLSKEFEEIIEIVASALERNPRRMKQFFNLFRFHRTIGLKIGLFTYKEGTGADQMWNCKKLAKFVAISMMWPSVILELNSNIKILDILQEYALKPENKIENINEWAEDTRLLDLLKYGCLGDNPSQNKAEYTLSGLDFSKLLEISPEVIVINNPAIGYPGPNKEKFKDNDTFFGSREEVEEQYKLALEANINDAATHSNYGIFLKKMRRYDEAENQIKFALEIDPNNSALHTNYGLLLEEIGRIEEAEKQYKLALEIDPTNSSAYNNYRSLPKKLGRKEETEELKIKTKSMNGLKRSNFEYDVAMSYASENRKIVEQIAKRLTENNIRVFFDHFEKSELFGKRLSTYFQQIYGVKACFVLVFYSKEYSIKDWTNFEFTIALDKAKVRKTQFILPVRLDNTPLFGLPEDTAYLDFGTEGIEGIVKAVIDKVNGLHRF